MNVRYLRGTTMVGPHTAATDWIGAEEAEQYYLSQPGLTVASANVQADGTPEWQVRINPGGWFRFLFSGESGTPLREVTWEPRGDGLFCRQTTDLFYPDGDPARRVPYQEVTSATRKYFADGRVRAVLQAPGLDLARTLAGVETVPWSQPVPTFGRWAGIVDVSRPSDDRRFGTAASDAALTLALDDLGGEDVTGAPGLVSFDASGGWTMAATDRQIFEIAMAVAGGAPAPYGATVLSRGSARIIPLGVQGRAEDGGDPIESERRMAALDEDLRSLLSYRTQDPVQFLASERGWYDTEATAVHFDLLRAAGVTSAWYSFLPPTEQRAVMRVWAGDLARGTRTLALHVVPGHWCSDRRQGDPPRDVDLHWDRDDLLEG